MKNIESLDIDLDQFKDPKIKANIQSLFNIIEELSATIKTIQEENQELRNEINLLKGEKPKPKINPNTKGKNKDISSEKERKTKKDDEKKKDKSKLKKINIDRTIKCTLDKNDLPDDAVHKGFRDVVVQDISISTDNIKFKKEVYHSEKKNKTYLAKLPLGYEGEFGPNIKALTIILKNVCNVSEPKILELFKQFKIKISAYTISNFLIKNKEEFKKEKIDIFKAGLESSPYQQIDDTSARVNGENHYTQILCNEFYSAYFTRPRKDRLTILDIISGYTLISQNKKRKYTINDETIELLRKMRVNKNIISKLDILKENTTLTEEEMKRLIRKNLPSSGKNQITRVHEASAIAAYHQMSGWPIIKILLCDDAKQFKLLTELLALCWIHDGRHYKKINPIVPNNKEILQEFLDKYWKYYHTLLSYKNKPTKGKAKKLSVEFDKLFSTITGYDDLDERIKRTQAKKDELLLVLKMPELPLHNNAAELAARAQVRIRDISLQTITDDGTEANDTFLSLVQTAKKLGINIYDYILDRVSKMYKMQSLADTIKMMASGP